MLANRSGVATPRRLNRPLSLLNLGSEAVLVHGVHLSRVPLSVVIPTLFTSLAIGAAVATHTVIQITDTLIRVLAQNVGHRVLVAAVAGVAAVVVVHMAGHARCVMVLVQYE